MSRRHILFYQTKWNVKMTGDHDMYDMYLLHIMYYTHRHHQVYYCTFYFMLKAIFYKTIIKFDKQLIYILYSLKLFTVYLKRYNIRRHFFKYRLFSFTTERSRIIIAVWAYDHDLYYIVLHSYILSVCTQFTILYWYTCMQWDNYGGSSSMTFL